MKLLCICDPALYPNPTMDVPTLYQKLARDPRIDLFHVPVDNVIHPDQVSVISVPRDLDYGEFTQLNQRQGEMRSLTDFDLVFCRRLKPFPLGYLQCLAQWESQIRFINRPSGKIEQMKPDFFPRIAKAWMPDHLVTDQIQPLEDFLDRHQTIVAKRTNSCGGRGVFKFWRQDHLIYLNHLNRTQLSYDTVEEALAYLLDGQSDPILFVRYLQNVTAGDKRVVVVDGEIYGAYLRKSSQGSWVNNVSAGGDCSLSNLTLSEQMAIEQTVGAYKELGLHTLGYDFLLGDDDRWTISEINAGNIGGFARLETLTGDAVCDRLINWMLDYSTTSIGNKSVTGNEAN